MTNTTNAATDTVAATADPTLYALRLAEENACGGYLTARKSMVRLAGQAASLRQLSDEHPKRADYRAAAGNALTAFGHAAQRTRLAYQAWQRAVFRSDAHWTATDGRTPRLVAVADPATGGAVA